MRLLILGSKGFIGSNAEVYFKSLKDYNVTTISRSFLDLEDSYAVEEYFKRNEFDIILNCAGYVGGISRNIREPFTLIARNLALSINLVNICSKYKIKLFNFGSSCMYPSNIDGVLKISDLFKGDIEVTSQFFATYKLTMQKILDAAEKQFELNWVTLVPATVYGPNDNFSISDGHVVAGLIHKFYNAKLGHEVSVELFGSGKTIREFIHIYDLLNAIDLLIKESIERSIVNIGSGHEIKIVDLATKIKNIFEYGGDVVSNNDYPNGNERRLLDSNFINSLGWSPRIDLNGGLKSTCDWFAKNYPNLRL